MFRVFDLDFISALVLGDCRRPIVLRAGDLFGIVDRPGFRRTAGTSWIEPAMPKSARNNYGLGFWVYPEGPSA